MLAKNPKAKGYLLTFLGSFIATLIASVVSYFVVTKFITNNMLVTRTESWESLVNDDVANLGVVLFAFALFVVIFQVLILVLAPYLVNKSLKSLPNNRKTTIIWLDVLLFLNPLIPFLLSFAQVEARYFFWLVILWILLVPFISRYIATRKR